MEFRDRQTRDAVAEIASLLATAYQRYRRARRIETAATDSPEAVNGELDLMFTRLRSAAMPTWPAWAA